MHYVWIMACNLIQKYHSCPGLPQTVLSFLSFFLYPGISQDILMNFILGQIPRTSQTTMAYSGTSQNTKDYCGITWAILGHCKLPCDILEHPRTLQTTVRYPRTSQTTVGYPSRVSFRGAEGMCPPWFLKSYYIVYTPHPTFWKLTVCPPPPPPQFAALPPSPQPHFLYASLPMIFYDNLDYLVCPTTD